MKKFMCKVESTHNGERNRQILGTIGSTCLDKLCIRGSIGWGDVKPSPMNFKGRWIGAGVAPKKVSNFSDADPKLLLALPNL